MIWQPGRDVALDLSMNAGSPIRGVISPQDVPPMFPNGGLQPGSMSTSTVHSLSTERGRSRSSGESSAAPAYNMEQH